MNKTETIDESTYEFCVGGVKFSFWDPTNAVGVETMTDCIYEPTTTTLLQRLLRDGSPTFLDVGAHYGYFACYTGKLNPNARVLAFEPGEKHVTVLERNLAANRLTNVEVHRCALSDEIGKVPFTDRTMKLKAGFEIETISAITLDELASRSNFKPQIVKIDVHGAEGKVLGGMRRSLRSDVDVVIIEIHAAHLLVDYSHRQVLDFLREAGLHIYECANFRRQLEPQLVTLEGRAYEDFANPECWTADQVKNERMILASRMPWNG